MSALFIRIARRTKKIQPDTLFTKDRYKIRQDIQTKKLKKQAVALKFQHVIPTDFS